MSGETGEVVVKSISVAPKSHHYNPQVYLRQYTNPARKNELLEFDLTTGTAKESTPKLCGCEDYYHSFEREDGVRDDESIVQGFGKLENTLPQLFEAVRNKQPISDRLWGKFFVFAALQRARCPKAIYELQNAWSEAFTRQFEMWKQTPEFDQKVTHDGFDPDKIRKQTVNLKANRDLILAGTLSAFKNGVLPKLFNRMKWAFLSAPVGKSFFTSDDPVCCWAEPDKRGPFGAIGPASEHVEITFPLSRRICAFGSWKSCPPQLYNPLRADEADAINYRTVQNGYHFVYGPTKDTCILDLVEEAAKFRQAK